MTDSNNPEMVHRLWVDGKEVVLVGTAHVSRESVDLVKAVIEAEQPDTVAVELCSSRFQAMRRQDQWREMDIVRVIREQKVFLLLSSLLLAAFQRRIAEKLEVKPGAEMIQAIESAEAMGATVYLADRDVRTTLSRTWRAMGLRSRVRMIVDLVVSLGEVDKIDESQVEAMKQQDVLEVLLSEIGKSMPELREILIDERDRYLTEKIRSAPGKKVVAVVGAGHVPGIRRYWECSVDLSRLEQLPPKRRWTSILKWGLPLVAVLLIGTGFFWRPPCRSAYDFLVGCGQRSAGRPRGRDRHGPSFDRAQFRDGGTAYLVESDDCRWMGIRTGRGDCPQTAGQRF